MRRCFEDSVKRQALIDEVEEVAPVPGIIFDHSVRVQLYEQVEDEEDNACRPSQYEQQPALFWPIETRNGKETVRYKVTHQNQVYNTPEDKPGVVLKWSIFELVVLGNLGFHLPLEEPVDRWVWVLAGLRIFKNPRIFRPKDKPVVFGLGIEKPANACIVSGTPEEEDYGEDWYTGAFGQ